VGGDVLKLRRMDAIVVSPLNIYTFLRLISFPPHSAYILRNYWNRWGHRVLLGYHPIWQQLQLLHDSWCVLQ